MSLFFLILISSISEKSDRISNAIRWCWNTMRNCQQLGHWMTEHVWQDSGVRASAVCNGFWWPGMQSLVCCRKTKLTSFRIFGVAAFSRIYRRYYVLSDAFGPWPGRIREPIPYPTICPIGMGSGNVSRKGMRNDLLSKLRDINEDKSHRKMCGAVVSPQLCNKRSV